MEKQRAAVEPPKIIAGCVGSISPKLDTRTAAKTSMRSCKEPVNDKLCEQPE
jgi:hypothetical protein